MKERKLKYGAQPVKPLPGNNAVDSIMIQPRSSGTLNGGEYSKGDKRRHLRVKISATNNDRVKYQEKLLGSEEHYTVIYEVQNFNYSPAFASLVEE